jgi:hypothetical protein
MYNFIGNPFPITDPQSATGREAKTLWDRAADLHAKVEEIESRAYHAQRAATDARQALSDHLQDAAMHGKTATREKALTTALKAAEATADEPWTQRQDAARRASEAAHRDVSAFIGANGPNLLEDMRADAEAVADRVFLAAEQLRAALAEYTATGHRVTALTAHVEGIDGRDVVTASEWADDLQRGLRSITDRQNVPPPFVREGILAWAKGGQESASVSLDTMLGY